MKNNFTSSTHSATPSPRLPIFLATPFKMISASIHVRVLVIFLNRLLSQHINNGDLDFLENRRLCISVYDIGIKIHISFLNQQLTSFSSGTRNDLNLEANLFDFMSLAARSEDADTLVFQRRLVMQGDTELGLELKNFLDSIDIHESKYFSFIEMALKKTLPAYKHLFG